MIEVREPLRRYYDADAIVLIGESPDQVLVQIEDQIDAARRQRTFALAARCITAPIPELIDEGRQGRGGSVVELLHVVMMRLVDQPVKHDPRAMHPEAEMATRKA